MSLHGVRHSSGPVIPLSSMAQVWALPSASIASGSACSCITPPAGETFVAPMQRSITEGRHIIILEFFEAERPSLVPDAGRFDGFHALPAAVSQTCLVRLDDNSYSVAASAIGRPVDIRAYANRSGLRQNGLFVGERPRLDDLLSLALCAGFLPASRAPCAMKRPSRTGSFRLHSNGCVGSWRRRRDGDRQMIDILTTVLSDGLRAADAACTDALKHGVHSADVVLDILARRREPTAAITIMTPDALPLRHEPAADCARYDSLRRAVWWTARRLANSNSMA